MVSKEEDDYNIDIKSLIQFDLLQNVIGKFIKNQKKLEMNILDLQKRAIEANKKISSLEITMKFISNKTYNTINESFSPEYKDRNNINIVKKDKKENEEIDKISYKTFEHNKKIENEFNSGIEIAIINKENNKTQPIPNIKYKNIPLAPNDAYYSENTNNLGNLNELNENLTHRIEAKEKNITKFKYKQHKNSNINNDIKDEDDNLDLEDKVSILSKEIKELKEKLRDIDIYSMFKDSGNSNYCGIPLMIRTLERKTEEKINYIEEKLKNINQNIVKSKNDITNLQNFTDISLRNSNSLKESYENFQIENKNNFNTMEQKLTELNEQTKTTLTQTITDINNKLRETLELHEKKLNSLESNPNAFKANDSSIVDNDKLNKVIDQMKALINKSIDESENFCKSSINNLNINKIKKDINSIKQSITPKLEKKDLGELYLKQENFNTDIIMLKEQIDYIKINMSLISETNSKAIRQVEFFSGILNDYKSANNDNSDNANKLEIDFSQFATTAQINQKMLTIASELKKLNKENTELKDYIIKIEKTLETFSSERDLKNMEQCLLSEIEETKASSIKRFADKNEIQKSLRYIDLQIKHLSEVFNMSKENDDNCLLAKRPIGLYHCASCNSFIGELSKKKEYFPWNKIPQREDNKYRMGHGFSKMLQLVNMDILKNIENMNDSKEGNNYNSNSNFLNGQEEGNKKIKGALPKINKINTQSESINKAIDNSDGENSSAGVISSRITEPKVTKIYKKVRNYSVGEQQRGIYHSDKQDLN